ncbi:MAG: hypothetical protein ACTSPN_07600 [Promethearchaeota archaeon]
MINRYFKDNWNKILKFNSKVEINENPELLEEFVRIPLTPIQIDAFLLYKLTELIYPKFIHDQQNIADIILSDYSIENLVLESYVYETKIAGIHEKVIHLPKNAISITTKNDLDNIEGLFTRIQDAIIKISENGIKIMSIRIFKKRAIDLMNSHCENLKKLSFNEFISNLLDLAQKCIENELIILYPEPDLLRFMRELISLFQDIKFSSIYKLLNNLCPTYKHAISFNTKTISFTCQIEKEVQENAVEVIQPEQAPLDSEESRLSKLREDNKLESVISLDLNTLINSLSEIFEQKVPIKMDQMKLLIQKILFGLRSFDTHWKMYPRPKIYNVLNRYLLRLIGFNVNLRKLSHWNLPEFIFNLFNSNIGLSSKILILLTNNKNKNIQNAIILQFLNGSLVKISAVNKTDAFDNKLDIKEIHSDLLETLGYIDFIFKVDVDLIKEIIEKFIFKIYNVSPLKQYKVLKMAKKSKYLEMYPSSPVYELFKSKSSLSLLKLLLPIFIDKHEF